MDSPSKLSYDTGVLQAIMEMKDSLSMQIKELKLQAEQPKSEPPPLPAPQPRIGTGISTASKPREQKLALEAMKDITGLESGRRDSNSSEASHPLSAWGKKAMAVLTGKEGHGQQHQPEVDEEASCGVEKPVPRPNSPPPIVPDRRQNSGNGGGAGLSDIFRAQEAVIAHNSVRVSPGIPEEVSETDTAGTCEKLFLVYVSKALGLVSLFDVEVTQDAWSCSDWLRHSMSRCYYFFLVIFLVYQSVWIYSLQDAEPLASCHVCMIDLAFILGAALVLMSFGGSGGLQERVALQSGAAELSKHLQKRNQAEEWQHLAWVDARHGICWLSLLISLHFAATWSSDQPNEENKFYVINMTLWHLAYCTSAFIMYCAAFWQIRTCRGMILTVRSWCDALLSGESDCRDARAEWRLISALFRRTSRALQSCAIASSFILIFVILAALYDFNKGQEWLSLLPAIPLMLLPIRVLLCQASTTTACTRLPSLLALCEGEDQEEEDEYLKLAMYVSFSECGFYVADMRLTLGLVKKFIYFTFAIGGSIAVRLPRFTSLLHTFN